MRTTVELKDPLFRELKMYAAKEGVTLKEVLSRAVEKEVRAMKGTTRRETRSMPVIRSKKPGSLHLSNAEIEDLLT